MYPPNAGNYLPFKRLQKLLQLMGQLLLCFGTWREIRVNHDAKNNILTFMDVSHINFKELSTDSFFYAKRVKLTCFL